VNASSSTSTATLGRSDNITYTYNLDRFLDQDMCDDATLHGRVPDHAFRPRPTACVPFYKARAANAIGHFEATFAASARTDAKDFSPQPITRAAAPKPTTSPPGVTVAPAPPTASEISKVTTKAGL
jgi:hypothetical protein